MVTLLLVFALLLILWAIADFLRKLSSDRVDRRPVPAFDLDRYMGEWFEIARLENRFERGMMEVTARYTLCPDGRVEVVNSGLNPLTGERKVTSGRAKPTSVPGRLRVSFAPLVSSEYNVLELDPDYRWAMVGGRSSAYLWILSRTPALDRDTLDRLKIRARERGYDVEQLLSVSQNAGR